MACRAADARKIDLFMIVHPLRGCADTATITLQRNCQTYGFLRASRNLWQRLRATRRKVVAALYQICNSRSAGRILLHESPWERNYFAGPERYTPAAQQCYRYQNIGKMQ